MFEKKISFYILNWYGLLVKQVKGENILGEILAIYITMDYSPSYTKELKSNSVC